MKTTIGILILIVASLFYVANDKWKEANQLKVENRDLKKHVQELGEQRQQDQAQLTKRGKQIADVRKREAELIREFDREQNRDFLDTAIPDSLRRTLCNHFGTCSAEAGN